MALAPCLTEVQAVRILATWNASLERTHWMRQFEQQWQDDPLVLDKWFTIQATSSRPDALENVRALLSHSKFDLTNPNRVRALIGAFSHGNPVRFHAQGVTGKYVSVALAAS